MLLAQLGRLKEERSEREGLQKRQRVEAEERHRAAIQTARERCRLAEKAAAISDDEALTANQSCAAMQRRMTALAGFIREQKEASSREAAANQLI